MLKVDDTHTLTGRRCWKGADEGCWCGVGVAEGGLNAKMDHGHRLYMQSSLFSRTIFFFMLSAGGGGRH